MALRDQPYIPLYVQDFLTDEKLALCSAKATGVYIRLICLMHKSQQYGTIHLKQRFKQGSDNIKNFSSQLVKHLPYDFHTVTESLAELLDENVLTMEGDILIQKRMVRDNQLSEKRSVAGKKGGLSHFAKANAQAKVKANTEYESESNVVNDISVLEIGKTKEFCAITLNRKYDEKRIVDLWKAFIIQDHIHYSEKDKYRHFRNWIKTQPYTEPTDQKQRNEPSMMLKKI